MLKQSGWKGFPSGNEKPAMEIALSKQEIESRYGLSFISGEDSLGKVYSTYFNDEVIGPATIACYEKSPNGRAVVFIDSAVALNEAVPRLLDVFSLDPSLTIVPRGMERHS